MGIEPTSQPWQGCILPLYDSRETSTSKLLERAMGIEPTQSVWKTDILPLNYTRSNKAPSL